MEFTKVIVEASSNPLFETHVEFVDCKRIVQRGDSTTFVVADGRPVNIFEVFIGEKE